MRPNKSWFDRLSDLFLKATVCIFLFVMSLTTFAFADEGVVTPAKEQRRASSRLPEQNSAANQRSLKSKIADRFASVKNHLKNPLKGKISSPAIWGIQTRVRPHFYADNSYNSNATNTRKPDPAWQARVSPGVTLEVPYEKLFTSVDYTYSYATNQGRHSTSHTNTHNIDALARYDLTAKTVLGVHNNTQWSELPGSPGNVFFLQTDRAEVQHQLGTKLESNLAYQFQHFKDVTVAGTGTSNDTFNDHQVSLSEGYSVTDSLKVGPAFSWSVRKFDKVDKNYWQIKPDLHASHALGVKTKVYGHFGWAYRRFDVGDGEESELIYGGGVTHLLGRKFVWDVNYEKSLQDTFDTGFVLKPTGNTATNLDNFDRRFRVVKNQRINTEVTYNINERNSAGVFGAAQFARTDTNDNVFSNDENDEKKMEVGAGYTYRLTSYAAFKVQYVFGRNFDSHGPAREQYTFHKATAGVMIAL